MLPSTKAAALLGVGVMASGSLGEGRVLEDSTALVPPPLSPFLRVPFSNRATDGRGSMVLCQNFEKDL